MKTEDLINLLKCVDPEYRVCINKIDGRGPFDEAAIVNNKTKTVTIMNVEWTSISKAEQYESQRPH